VTKGVGGGNATFVSCSVGCTCFAACMRAPNDPLKVGSRGLACRRGHGCSWEAKLAHMFTHVVGCTSAQLEHVIHRHVSIKWIRIKVGTTWTQHI
jgi:hypothetical protein